jgi:hypothetical protein
MSEIREISLSLDVEDLEKLILNYAKTISGFSFDHVDIEIKKNNIQKIVCYSHIKSHQEQP